MAFRADNLKPACRSRFLVQLNIRTTPSHIGRNGNRPMDPRIGYDFGFQFMEFSIQYNSVIFTAWT